MTTPTSLTRQAAWLMAAKFFTFALAVVAPLLIVRRLNAFEYGLYKESFQAIISAVGMLPLGFGMSAYYFLPRHPKNQPAVVVNVIAVYLLLGLAAWIVLAAYPRSLVLLFKQPELAAYAPAIGAIILFSILGGFLDVITVANQEIRIASLCLIGAQLSRGAMVRNRQVSHRCGAASGGAAMRLPLGVFVFPFPGFLEAFGLASAALPNRLRSASRLRRIGVQLSD